MTKDLIIRPGEWISIGNISAVISKIYDNSNAEVVYLDDRNQAINEDAVLVNNSWKFKYEGVSGGYADKNSRLREFVGILRRGRK